MIKIIKPMSKWLDTGPKPNSPQPKRILTNSKQSYNGREPNKNNDFKQNWAR